MKSLISLLSFFFIVSCATKPVSLTDKQIQDQAEAYTTEHLLIAHGFRPAIIKSIQGNVNAIIFLDVHSEFIGLDKYTISPEKQFYQLIKENPYISYSEANKKIKFDRKNYFVEDCNSIGTFLESLSERELTPYPSTDIDLEMPTYAYIYEVPGVPSYSVLYVTSIKDHPIIDIYKDALKEIENCPHPKDPPKFD